MSNSVCVANLNFSFNSKKQINKFIKLFLKKSKYITNFSYNMTTNVDSCGHSSEIHSITINNIHWARNLTKISKLIGKCDYNET